MSPSERTVARATAFVTLLLVAAALAPTGDESGVGAYPALAPSESSSAAVPAGSREEAPPSSAHRTPSAPPASEGTTDVARGGAEVRRFRAQARPVDGTLLWDSEIVARSARGIVAQGGELHLDGKAEVFVRPDRLEVRSGWYRWAIPWREVHYISASETNSEQIVLCVKPLSGEVIVLSDVDLGPAAYDVAEIGTARIKEAQPERWR